MENRQDYLKKNKNKITFCEKDYAYFLRKVVNNQPEYYKRFLLCKFNSGQRILDFGCGPGKLLELLKKKFPDVYLYGCDVNRELVKRCKANPNLKGVNFSIVKKNEKTFYRDSFFDIIFLLDVLEHTSNPHGMLREINRILKRGGKLVINTPDRLALILDPAFYGNLFNLIPFNVKRLFGKAFMEYSHQKEFSFRELRIMTRNYGFKIVKANNRDFIYMLPFLHRGSITLLLEKVTDYEF